MSVFLLTTLLSPLLSTSHIFIVRGKLLNFMDSNDSYQLRTQMEPAYMRCPSLSSSTIQRLTHVLCTHKQLPALLQKAIHWCQHTSTCYQKTTCSFFHSNIDTIPASCKMSGDLLFSFINVLYLFNLCSLRFILGIC